MDEQKDSASVHQPPVQNLEDKNSGEMQTKASSLSSVVIPESVSLKADQWKPIKTAPKDSSWILAVMRTGRQTVIRWGGGAWEDDNRLCRDPTHWMPLPANPITQDTASASALSTTVPDHSPASSPKPESPSESESTLVTVATEALDEVLAFPHTADADTYLVARAQLAALKTRATELSVHQPDVQVVDEVSKEQDNAKS